MHEYHLLSNALDGLLQGNRKNYVLCMIKCNSDKKANSTPSFHEYEYERHEPMTINRDGILDLERGQAARELKLVAAKAKPKSSSSTNFCRKCCNNNPFVEYILLVVGIIALLMLIIIFSKIYNSVRYCNIH
ncbi:uncharacterized protein LOC116202949 isoform X2 [Punica granatum]|uniref:Uncharacterized protein LOC116202949 isoform X2 n=1 Tax=Punica granatum TaxID=22663 RepID=A0A6P8D237_PUNGR|nr:uncharacterized protein LOC116202949 isoform X2 [Punica granatum]